MTNVKIINFDVIKAGTSKAEKTKASTEEEQPEPETTLFVKNLNFSTTDDSLLQHFQNCGRVFSAVVAKKKDPKKPGETLSMGYGFVQFWNKKSTVEALKELQNSNLDGHVIELKVSINRFTRHLPSNFFLNSTLNFFSGQIEPMTRTQQ